MKKSKISKTIELLFKIILILGIVCTIFLPQLYNTFKGQNIPLFKEQTILYRIAFYTCYLICLGIVYTLNSIFNRIYKDTPFTITIVNYLKIIALLFMILSVIVLLKTIFIPSILSIAVIIVTFITSLCFYALSQIFKMAIEYKDEVDFTI